jgi:formate/nitrite transporter FocA (FNT family)
MTKKREPTLSNTKKAVTVATEQKQVEDRVAIGVNVVYEAIRREGDEELQRPVTALAWSALAAGLSMGFSFIAEGMLRTHLPDRPWRPLISRMGYCVGFLVVILARQQLFTENTLTVILPLLLRKSQGILFRVLRVWGVVLAANLVGTFLFALVVARSALFQPEVQRSLAEIGIEHTGASFGTVFVRAIFAGWLIALMVWLLPAADSSRVVIIIILTYLVGLGGFNHIIAGSTTMFYLIVTSSLGWGAYLVHFFLPTLLGNITGGVSLVACLGHAQVLGGKAE